jgi:hypothetical protein
LALAALTLLGGGFIAVTSPLEQAAYAQYRHEGISCLKKADRDGKLYLRSYDPGKVDAERSGCANAPYLSLAELRASAEQPPAYWATALPLMAEGFGILLLCIVAAFAVPWGFGWILSGFFQD